jgi:predicted RNase H-like HicB family nuclease
LSDTTKNYIAVAEPSDDGKTWWISFPGHDGIISAADDAGQIVQQAQDALASATMHGGRLPPSIEDGAAPPGDLSDFRSPAMVVVIPFAASHAPQPSDLHGPHDHFLRVS